MFLSLEVALFPGVALLLSCLELFLGWNLSCVSRLGNLRKPIFKKGQERCCSFPGVVLLLSCLDLFFLGFVGGGTLFRLGGREAQRKPLCCWDSYVDTHPHQGTSLAETLELSFTLG